MAAPGVYFRGFDHAGPHRIEMDVTDQLQQITVTINQNRFETPLKEMTVSFLPPVDSAGKTKREILHAVG